MRCRGTMTLCDASVQHHASGEKEGPMRVILWPQRHQNALTISSRTFAELRKRRSAYAKRMLAYKTRPKADVTRLMECLLPKFKYSHLEMLRSTSSRTYQRFQPVVSQFIPPYMSCQQEFRTRCRAISRVRAVGARPGMSRIPWLM